MIREAIMEVNRVCTMGSWACSSNRTPEVVI